MIHWTIRRGSGVFIVVWRSDLLQHIKHQLIPCNLGNFEKRCSNSEFGSRKFISDCFSDFKPSGLRAQEYWSPLTLWSGLSSTLICAVVLPQNTGSIETRKSASERIYSHINKWSESIFTFTALQQCYKNEWPIQSLIPVFKHSGLRDRVTQSFYNFRGKEFFRRYWCTLAKNPAQERLLLLLDQ